MAFICTLSITDSFGVTLHFSVFMPKVVNDPSVTQFDIFGKGVGSQLFMINLISMGVSDTTKNLRLRYMVDYYAPASIGNIPAKQKLYEGLSNVFFMPPDTMFKISSTQFLKKGNPQIPVSLSQDIYELPDGELKKKIYATQKMPDGVIRYTMILEQNGGIISRDNSDHTIINSSYINLIYPGKEISGTLETLTDQHPQFSWTSDLWVLNNEKVFELRVYEARTGESFTQAMNREPILKKLLSGTTFRYPNTGRQLELGHSYYWEVIGRSPLQPAKVIKSSPFGFRMLKTVNPLVQQVIEILRNHPAEYSASLIKRILDYDSDVTIKLRSNQGVETISVDRLQKVVDSLKDNSYSSISTTVY